ncbi:hypothetical protein AGMMS49975_21900 [Clostridia bacterium]|nr:hypothetical protein AGMMS49975_21900 [Clostridia bacterium]
MGEFDDYMKNDEAENGSDYKDYGGYEGYEAHVAECVLRVAFADWIENRVVFPVKSDPITEIVVIVNMFKQWCASNNSLAYDLITSKGKFEIEGGRLHFRLSREWRVFVEELSKAR